MKLISSNSYGELDVMYSKRPSASAVRWYACTLKHLLSTQTGTSSRFVANETIVRVSSMTRGDSALAS
jgi:hypothetical protein